MSGAMSGGPADDLERRVAGYLAELTMHPDRRVGGPGNRAATALFAEVTQDLGWGVSRREFACLDWDEGEGLIEAGEIRLPVHVGPYSPACELDAPLVAVSVVEELEREDVRGAIVLLHGEIASGQVMPRNFRFYNPEEHQRIYRALDQSAPAAVVAATGRDPSMLGSQYPFPLFEDGDLDVANAYLRDTDGERLLAHAGQRVRLHLESRRIPAVGEHVVARLAGSGEGRAVLTAHIDSRRGSPGGLDNGSGVATLLGVAGLLADESLRHTVEIVPFNGEDDYANPGELLWIEENEGRFGDIVLGINVDDSSQRATLNHVSFYDCPREIEVVVRQAMEHSAHIEAGPQWYQGDHMILGMYGRPAVAIASSEMAQFMAAYAHSERDVPELADPALMAETARFIAEVVRELG